MSQLRDAVFELYIYGVFVGVVQGALTPLAVVLLMPAALRIGWRGHFRLSLRVLVFSGLLYLVGNLASLLWMLGVFRRWYVSADTVVDFWPFLPFGQWVQDVEFGGVRGRLLGGTRLWQLRLLWAALAAAVWAATVWLDRRLVRWVRNRHARRADEPLPVGPSRTR